jgi:cell wall-associated NlpC family hydrolase
LPRPTDVGRCAALGLALIWCPRVLPAQRALELHFGRASGDGGSTSASYELRTSRPFGRAFAHGLGATILVDDDLGRRRAFYGAGYELQALRRRRAFGPYVLLGAQLGLSTDSAGDEVAVLWSAGGGLEWRPFSSFAIGAEARYRLEDRGPRGFWNAEDGRDGIGIAVGVTIGLGKREAGSGKRSSGNPPSSAFRPPLVAPATITGSASDVVHTALDALGTPYRWGGTAENGFDCSGLIQYAYGQHGVMLPRTSRDQARAGNEIERAIAALAPGDILTFAADPGGRVSHVGMYVGEGKFIHSSSTGVKLSRLDYGDPEGRWWLPGWVGVRRVM